jgi:hypothetical protein
MGLTTILTTICFVHRTTPKCKIIIFKEDWTSKDVRGDAADVWGSRVSRVQISWDVRLPEPAEVGHSTWVLGMTARLAGNAVGEYKSLSMREAVMGKQTMRQAARLAAFQVQAKRRRERAERDRLGEVRCHHRGHRATCRCRFAGDDHRRAPDRSRCGAVVRWGNQPSRSGPASPANRAGRRQQARGPQHHRRQHPMTPLLGAVSMR